MTDDVGAGTDGSGDAVLADRDGDGVPAPTFHRPELRNGCAADLQQAYRVRPAGAAARDRSGRLVVTGAGSTSCPVTERRLPLGPPPDRRVHHHRR